MESKISVEIDAPCWLRSRNKRSDALKENRRWWGKRIFPAMKRRNHRNDRIAVFFGVLNLIATTTIFISCAGGVFGKSI